MRGCGSSEREMGVVVILLLLLFFIFPIFFRCPFFICPFIAFSEFEVEDTFVSGIGKKLLLEAPVGKWAGIVWHARPGYRCSDEFSIDHEILVPTGTNNVR